MCWGIQKRKTVTQAFMAGVLLIGLCVGVAGADFVDRVLVVVNDDIILQSEFDKVLSKLKTSIEKQGYSRNDQFRMVREQRGKILQKLIYDKLTDQQVKRYKLSVKDEEVDATIQRIRNANKLSVEEFHRAVELDGLTYEAYRNQMKDKILRSRLVNYEVKSKIVVTPDDIKQYYDKHVDRYAGSTKYELRHILIKAPSDANRDEKAEALKQINQIHERLQGGEPFKNLAKQFSHAPTASQGGRLGVFGTQLLTKEITTALEGLQPKDYSKVVDSDQGYQIFYVEDIIHTGGKSLEDASGEIREKLYAEVVDQRFQSWIKELQERSHIKIVE